MVLPLFFTQATRNSFTFVTALGGYTRTGTESTLITPVYQNHRGLTNVDAIAPLFYYSRTERTGAHTFATLLGFHSSSPTGYAWSVFPLLGRFHEYGRYDTTATLLFVHTKNYSLRTSATWVFPTVHAETAPNYHLFNIYPLLYTAGGRDRAGGNAWHHEVVFPFFWNVGNEATHTRITVAAPFFVRVANHNSVNQWTFPNHFYWESRSGGQRAYGWDFFPFVQYGVPRRGDVAWSVFEGLVGYRRSGTHEQLRILYIPFNLSGSATPAAAQARSNARRTANGDVLLDL